MSNRTPSSKESAADRFARQAEQRSHGLIREFIDFLIHNKKWWLTPIIIVLLLVGAALIAGGTGLAPFIYTLF